MSSGDAFSQSEVRFCYTDFFDTSGDAAAPYFQQTFSTVASLIASSGVSPTRRILGADLWALPKFSLETAESAYLFLTCVPTNPASSGTAPGAAGNIQNTIILPKSDAQWVKVGSWRSKTLFAETTIGPAINSAGDMAVFAGVVLNPDNLTPVGALLQCKICVYFSESVPQTANLKVFHSNLTDSSTLTSVMSTASSSRAVVLSVTGVSNTV